MKLKHGDNIIAVVGREHYKCHIEERFASKSPSKKKLFCVCFDTFPRPPIPLNNFLKFYGTVQLIESEQQSKDNG